MKTPPILLKLLHKSAAKPSPNFKKTASRKGEGGFTLLEVLIVVLIVGIFASIAAPSWLAFINRQRVRTVNDRVFQSLRLAQSEAKRTKRDIRIEFDTTVDPPKVKFDPPLATGGSEQKLDAGGEIKPGTIALTTNAPAGFYIEVPPIPANSIVFDYQGNVKALPPTNSAIPNARRFVLTVAPANATPNSSARQCAIVETLIGGMRTAEGKECD